MNKLGFLLSIILIPIFAFAQIDLNVSKSINTYSGNIYMGENLLPKGNIYLINNSKGILSTEDETEILSGAYSFIDVTDGEYTLYVIPDNNYDFFYFPKYIPTYSGSFFKWENSKTEQYVDGALSKDIHLISYSEPFYGHCKISGKIKYDAEYKGKQNIQIPIILLNEKKVPMDFKIANEYDGTFLFEYLPEGTYYIQPEIPGIKSEELKIIIRTDNDIEKVSFLIDNFSIKPEDDEIIKPIISENTLKVFLDEEVSFPLVCELTDMSGRLVLKNVYSSKEIFINTSQMTVGIYLLRVRSFDNTILKTAKVYINNY